MSNVLHFGAAEALTELQNGALWHANSEEELKTIEKPSSSHLDDRNNVEHMFWTILEAVDLDCVQKPTKLSSQALHTVWKLIKLDVEVEIRLGRKKARFNKKSVFRGDVFLKIGESWQFYATVF